MPDNYWEQVEELESQVVDDSASLAEVETPVQPVIQPIVTPTTVSPRTITSRSATRAVASAPVATTTRVNTPSRAVASRNASASIRNMANPNSGTVRRVKHQQPQCKYSVMLCLYTLQIQVQPNFV